MLRVRGPSVYAMAASLGGLIVVIYLVGSLLVSCLTIKAYEDHLVQAMYPTKDILKDRLKVYMS